MPLYNRVTSLQSQGRFAPGVQYYAGVKAPRRNDFTLPKADASFNIDLSKIGDALLRVEELKYDAEQKQLAREDRIRELEFEDKRLRDLADLDRQYKYDALGVTREGNYLDFAAAMARLQQDKEKSGKDLAGYNMLQEGLVALNKERDQKGGAASMYSARAEQLYNTARNYTGYSNWDVAKAEAIMENYGYGSKAIAKSREEEEYNIRAQKEKQFQTAYDSSNYLQALEPSKARALYDITDNQIQTYLSYRSVTENPDSTEEEKLAARDNMIKSGVALSKLGIYDYIYNVATSSKIPQNPVELKTTIRQNAIERASQLMGRNDAIFTVDKAMQDLGLNQFVQQASEAIKDNKEIGENLIVSMTTDDRLNLMNVPLYRQFVALTPGMQQGILNNPVNSQTLLKGISGIIDTASGPILNDNGTVTYNRKVYTKDEIDAARELTGMQDPLAAIPVAANQNYTGTLSAFNQGLATTQDILKSGRAALTTTAEVSVPYSNEDVPVAVENFSKLYKNNRVAYSICKEKGSIEDQMQCAIMVDESDLGKNTEFMTRMSNIIRNHDTAGNFYHYGLQKDGDNINIFLLDMNKGFSLSAHDYNATEDFNKYVRSLPNFWQSKTELFKFFLDDRLQIIKEGAEVSNKYEPNILQKGVTSLHKGDQALQQAVD